MFTPKYSRLFSVVIVFFLLFSITSFYVCKSDVSAVKVQKIYGKVNTKYKINSKKNVKWISKNKEIVSVNNRGILHFKKVGYVRINGLIKDKVVYNLVVVASSDKWTKVNNELLPSASPTLEPTSTVAPTLEPTSTVAPTLEPTSTVAPTTEPTSTATPTVEPTSTVAPTTEPTSTVAPTAEPTSTAVPTVESTSTPTPIASPTAVPTSTSTAIPTPTPIPDLDEQTKKEYALTLATLINQERKANNKKELSVDWEALNNAAQLRADEMAATDNFIKRPDGRPGYTVINDMGIIEGVHSGKVENPGYGRYEYQLYNGAHFSLNYNRATPQRAFAYFQSNSRDDMLEATPTHMGIGVARSKTGIYYWYVIYLKKI